jgi:hypothetical protein
VTADALLKWSTELNKATPRPKEEEVADCCLALVEIAYQLAALRNLLDERL